MYKYLVLSFVILLMSSSAVLAAKPKKVTVDENGLISNYLYTSDEIIAAVKSKSKGKDMVIPYFGDYLKANIRVGKNTNGLWYLSNYFVSDPSNGMGFKIVIIFNNKKYIFHSTEAAYQAGKSLIAGTISTDDQIREFVNATPNYSKYLANTKYKYRKQGKQDLIDQLMENIVYQKFANSPLGKMLIEDTGHTTLIEGNEWGDTYWGQPFDGLQHSPGQSKLGKILMKVRDDLRKHKVHITHWQID